MKALIIDQPGPIENLRLAEMPQPFPGVGEVRVQVHAVSLNPADYKFMKRGFRTWQYPFIPGLDVAGVIDCVGEEVTNWQVGDRVYYHGDFSKPGGFAEYAITTAHTISAIPSNLSFLQAAALPCAGFTAYQVLHYKLHIQSGQTILIQGGAGGVGGFAVQLAAKEGLEVISTASPRNFDWIQTLGAKWVLDYHTDDVALRVKEITQGLGVDAIADTVGVATSTEGLEMLAFGGGIACIVGLPDFSKMQSFGKAISVHDVALGGAHLSGNRKAQTQLAKIGDELGELVNCQSIDPMIQDVISLEEISQGLMRLSQRQVRGKIVAKIQN